MLRTFALPALVAGASLCGLIAALVWDGAPERWAVTAVALPLLVLAWAVWRRRR